MILVLSGADPRQLTSELERHSIGVTHVESKRLAFHAKRLGRTLQDLASLAALAGSTGCGSDTLYLEVTNACNLRCLYCPLDTVTRPGAHMSTDDAFRIIDDYAGQGLGSMVHFVMGEPTLHRDLERIVAYGAERSIPQVLSTNASRLDGAGAVALFRRGLHVLCLAIQTHTEEQYHLYKRPMGSYTYEGMIANCRDILAALVRYEGHAELAFHVLDTSCNKPRGVSIVNDDADANDVVDFWRDTLSEVAEEQGRHDLVEYIASHREPVELARCGPPGGALLAPGFTVCFKMAGHWQQDFLTQSQVVLPANHGCCPMLNSSAGDARQLVFHSNGDAVMCCLDHDGGTRFGNINESSFEELAMKGNQLRASLMNSWDLPFQTCRKCLGMRVQGLREQVSPVGNTLEPEFERIMMFGTNGPARLAAEELRHRGLRFVGFVSAPGERPEHLEGELVLELDDLPALRPQALLFPPRASPSEALLDQLRRLVPDLFLGMIDLQALHPFERGAAERYAPTT